jgi:tetratricopeptide (TPR) repeat protein
MRCRFTRRLLARFVDVCNTVAFAHSQGVIHRDLKPGNIILDEYGEALVVDWGLAKQSGGDFEPLSPEHSGDLDRAAELLSTRPGDKLGTPAYMSPEQAAGRTAEAGPASDVYSLGATLYALLTGKPPFKGSDTSVVLSKVRAGEFPGPRQVNGNVPAALEAICMKAMELHPQDRYATPRALGEEIERWLADQPVLAYPEPLSARAARWVRQHKQWVAFAAAILVLGAIGLAMHDRQITRERDRLSMTRDALRDQLKVAGENLAIFPNTEGLRESLAQSLLDRYRRISDKYGTDPVTQLDSAQVYRVLAGIGRITGEYKKAQQNYEKAIALLTTLCTDDTRNAEYRRWLVEAYSERGELAHMNGRTIDAERDFRAAIDGADNLLKLPASLPEYGIAKAEALINLSEILALKKQTADGHQAANGASDLLRPLALPSADPKRLSRNRWLLGMALTDRGMASSQAGDEANASKDFDEAEQILSQIAPEDEYHVEAQFQFASISNQRGEMLSKDRSKLAEAESNFEKASTILLQLINDHKLISHYREEMAVTLLGRATARLAMGRVPDAERDGQSAFELVSRLIDEQRGKGAPESPDYLSLLARILALRSRILTVQGKSADGRTALEQAAENLRQAIKIDPAREIDRVRLDKIQSSLDHEKR